MVNNQPEGYIAAGLYEAAGYTIRKLPSYGKNPKWVVERGMTRYAQRHTLAEAKRWAEEHPFEGGNDDRRGRDRTADKVP